MHYLIQDTIFDILLKIKGLHIKNINRIRVFIEAVYYISKSGCQWRLLPFYYGNWRAIHKRFKQWSDKNIWNFIFESVQVDPDMEYAMIDSTIVRANACAAGYGKESQEKQALGRSKGGFTTKIHALVDALGNPLKIILTPGQRNDITQADTLVEELFDCGLLADKGYDADKLREKLKQQECITVIPSRSNRITPYEYDEDLYEERYKVECFFSKIKYFRRVFSRYDKTAQSFLSFVHFVGALIWLR